MKEKIPKPPSKNHPGCSEPSPYELAMLAAAVSQASTLDNLLFAIRDQGASWSLPDHSPELWVKEALALWLTAHGVLEKWRANPTDVFPKPAPQPAPEPEPKSYPVTLDKFLQLMLPTKSGRTGEKYGTFREYLEYRLRNPTRPTMMWAHNGIPSGATPFDCLNPRIVPEIPDDFSYPAQPSKPPEPTKCDLDRYFALWNTKGIPDRGSFLYHARYFREWYQTTHAAVVSNKRRAAGAKGLASPKRPKTKPKEKPDPPTI